MPVGFPERLNAGQMLKGDNARRDGGVVIVRCFPH
jgi:hypothetical protein